MALLKCFLVIPAVTILSCSHSVFDSETPSSPAPYDSLFDTVIQNPPVKKDSLIYDFAPMGIGTKWEYSYFYDGMQSTPAILIKDSFTIRIELASKKIRGYDTILLLRIKEQGTLIKSIASPKIDTTRIVSQYFDTVIFRENFILPAPGYRCNVFPFWKTHAIGIGSVGKFAIGNDTVYGMSSKYFAYPRGMTYGILSKEVPGRDAMSEKQKNDVSSLKGTNFVSYLQGIGLYSYSYRLNLNYKKLTINIDLISFNDMLIPNDKTN